MEVMKRLFLVLFFLLALFSCRRAGTANNIDDISLAKVYLAGKLKVGVDIPFAPLAFMEQNEYVGYDMVHLCHSLKMFSALLCVPMKLALITLMT